ncbi:Isopenicillin N epimerase component 1 [Madurella mycetomatis]|uniref:Isopenicillin N epimerase component 1 n=1 Tax=Madurella mycetomatis TaxID=100816 RepID=A0A175VVS2_9PEZI|nr:Isopenicillin N epimerase component 1 [Madurella mycetomatis]
MSLPLGTSLIGISQGMLALVGMAAGTAYLDAKLHISKDLHQLSRARRGERNLARAGGIPCFSMCSKGQRLIHVILAVKQKRASGFFLFEAAAQRLGDLPCIWSRQAEYTWSQAYERVCQYGHYFRDLGVTPSQYVGVYMYNSPELLFIWMGLLSIGAAPALINYNLASDALLHCVRLSKAQFLMYDDTPDCVSRIESAHQQLRNIGIETIKVSDTLKARVAENSPHRASVDCFEESRLLPFALMYTRCVNPYFLHGQTSSHQWKRNYRPTKGIPPHSGAELCLGFPAPKKPSASCRGPKVIGLIIVSLFGELVRYLLSAPPSPNDRRHQIRLIWGNGLSPELWTQFQDRFGVSEIGEFYASTEGVLTLVKHYRSPGFGIGAIGHHGWLLRRKFHQAYVPVHIDPETGEVWRSPETGFARRVPYDKGGEILVKLPSRSAWAGYWHAQEATEKKLLENVFEKGDLYFRTGDALRRDADGHWYFIDRLGDTYRWKGENVSTTEVSQVLGSDPEIVEANVYGVKIPNHDGRAGCAALVLKGTTPDDFDWARLAALLRSKLPPYAVPLFVRVREGGVGGMSTDNYKHNKVPLREEGVNPRTRGTNVRDGERDRVFWLPAGSSEYVPFTERDWDLLGEGRAKL